MLDNVSGVDLVQEACPNSCEICTTESEGDCTDHDSDLATLYNLLGQSVHHLVLKLTHHVIDCSVLSSFCDLESTLSTCPVTCGICEESDECQDTFQGAYLAFAFDTCVKLVNFLGGCTLESTIISELLKTTCPLTCGNCGDTPCQDRDIEAIMKTHFSNQGRFLPPPPQSA